MGPAFSCTQRGGRPRARLIRVSLSIPSRARWRGPLDDLSGISESSFQQTLVDQIATHEPRTGCWRPRRCSTETMVFSVAARLATEPWRPAISTRFAPHATADGTLEVRRLAQGPSVPARRRRFRIAAVRIESRAHLAERVVDPPRVIDVHEKVSGPVISTAGLPSWDAALDRVRDLCTRPALLVDA